MSVYRGQVTRRPAVYSCRDGDLLEVSFAAQALTRPSPVSLRKKRLISIWHRS